ncbi:MULTISPECIES: hypothetical protein [Prochlorococcus]|uniref:Protein family PM-12 n=1 Tax=Prochlorococcus marinus (strain SARG / CCMP1375 / SS120) TaxID=167539 RepID=Q7VAB6_PROMA|nr:MULTISPECIES: hypothetical protein [Prochlorococcus]AAQ00592.1 Predicted protein family PM-12 [Prochlorococcus marinus subsp. marinus str. CCMP1375]KGG10920.1 protein family PM-12 [Prochlorococcus marinus str. LG]KGG20504.1 protein family PM-12 [Prochlorococcus marinus str. SS2]KGG24169.1 protein family PM-12 [Prochlorococcus marinus str. SS35]KGG31573.1 protein family PM-12 [Prochlorococcus marinus str. SS51]
MLRTQLNININPDLLLKLKSEASKQRRTLTELVSDAITNQLNNTISERTLEARLFAVEQKISSLEKCCSQVSSGQKITPFTISEAENCNAFIKGVFLEETKRQQYNSSIDAWNDLIGHIECFDQWNDIITLRLKEALFIKGGDDLTCDEMNSLTKGKICPCPIRTGLINWINNQPKGKCSCANEYFPSQQTICDEGEKLLEQLYAL